VNGGETCDQNRAPWRGLDLAHKMCRGIQRAGRTDTLRKARKGVVCTWDSWITISLGQKSEVGEKRATTPMFQKTDPRGGTQDERKREGIRASRGRHEGVRKGAEERGRGT